jgi:glutamine amidotransferase
LIKPKVVVLDYGSGNVHSAVKALVAAGADVELTADSAKAYSADGLVIPGVGAFATVMKQLATVRGGDLIDQRLAASKPVFGICVGLQVLFAGGTEGDQETDGLAQWPGKVTKLNAPILPHMGWNNIVAPKGSKLFAGLEDEKFYFVHSFAAHELPIDAQPPFHPPLITWADYEGKFIAAVENGPLSGTQFHPEKSGAAGLELLQNWIATL